MNCSLNPSTIKTKESLTVWVHLPCNIREVTVKLPFPSKNIAENVSSVMAEQQIQTASSASCFA